VTLVLALLLDALLGEPRAIWSRVPHPAVLMGRAVDGFDRRLNHGDRRRLKGVLAAAILALGAGASGWLVAALLGGLGEVVLGAILLAQRSLVEHVRTVARALRLSTGEGRRAVALIVGRDTRAMEAPDVARAAVESAAENFSDGVVAPAFWFALGGLPGILIYKAVNTADSMIGHRTPRHEAFGWASARLDDALNWVPARASAVLIRLAGGGWGGWSGIARDARLHRSPNAGWPEAAMARSLDVALSGPRSYGGRRTEFPWVHPEGRREVGAPEVDASVRVLWAAWAILLGLAALLAPL
jgi:adenosylcobinamide-phosphate synthase